jgi:hypothetical protein
VEIIQIKELFCFERLVGAKRKVSIDLKRSFGPPASTTEPKMVPVIQRIKAPKGSWSFLFLFFCFLSLFN